MTQTELLEATKQWFIDRGLDQADPNKQYLKLYEELGELASGIAKNNQEVIKDSIGDVQVVIVGLCLQLGLDTEKIFDTNKLVLKSDPNDSSYKLSKIFRISSTSQCSQTEGEGLLHLTLRLLEDLSEDLNCDMVECLELAYNEIKDRKGKLVNGVFIKEADLVDNSDPVEKPSHYQGAYGLESIQVIENFIGNLTGKAAWTWGNLIKYILRFQKKNGLEDLKKARKNLDWLIEEMERKAR